ncbi:Transmembrane protein of unknown function [Haloechinothrix alba]|uniref:DUF3566 domain-containing protein n=1 Tax=Haloechinothrix alba TaxID=664784 RepID=A0A238V114_9PSEU|nr:Transmembrane protein of unknown function [Haloechinothrix alba]
MRDDADEASHFSRAAGNSSSGEAFPSTERTADAPGAWPDEPMGMFGHRFDDSSARAAGGAERPVKETARVNVPGTESLGRAEPSALRRPGRGPRRASLQVKRFDPWSVLKLSMVLGAAMFFVWLVAVGLLYTVLDGMGVWDRLNGTYASLVAGEPADAPVEPLITAGRVFGFSAVIGMINVVLMSALATVGAFIYNVSADMAGGLELTLSERE